MEYQDESILGIKKREAAEEAARLKSRLAKLHKLVDKLMILEDARIELEKKYVEAIMSEYYSGETELAIEIEKLLQLQKQTLIEIYDQDNGDRYGAAWRKLCEWRDYHQKHRLLPSGQGIFYDVKYCDIPEHYKDFELFDLLTASSSSHGLIRVSIGLPFSTEDGGDETIKAKHDFAPIVALAESLEHGKKKYPFIWSVDEHEPVYYSSIQIRHFVIPEFRSLRHETKSIYQKQLINYFTVLLRKAKEQLGVYIS
jgi:hypothetical protein